MNEIKMEKTTMTVKEFAIQLEISIPKAYELIRTPTFNQSGLVRELWIQLKNIRND